MRHFCLGLGALVSSLSVVGCGGGAGGIARPQDYKGGDALGAQAPVCEGAPQFARPLTVDLDADTRSDIEASMKSGVVVVAYDCVTLRVLDGCHSPSGDYQYAGISRKEEVVQMKGLDELKVNLPVGAANLSSEVKAGRTVDLALVSIGRRSSALSRLKRSELSGECAGATHYLQKAFLGAFSLSTGSAGKVSGVADLFAYSASGQSSSERKASSSDGSLEDCRAADPDAEKPPAQCRSPLRVELIPIVDDGAQAGTSPPPPPSRGEVAQNPCRTGYKLVDGVCSRELTGAYQCDPKDEDECRAQCDKGNAASCANVGALISSRAWKITWLKAKEEARPFFKKACDAGDMNGCAGYVRATFPSEKEWQKQVPLAKELIALNKTACQAGVGMACFDLGTFLGDVYEGAPFTNEAESLRYFERGCALGSPNACNTAGMVHIKKDIAKGMALYQRGCDGGDAFVCNQAAMRLIRGMDEVPKDPARGERMTKLACEMSIEDCSFSAELLVDLGKPADAFELARHGCEDKDTRTGLDEGEQGRAEYTRAASCKMLADFYEKGTGVTKDSTKATELYQRSCKVGYRPSCFILKQR